VSTTVRPILLGPAGLDRTSLAYREAVRAAVADAPPISPDVHALLRAILAHPARDAAGQAAMPSSAQRSAAARGSGEGARRRAELDRRAGLERQQADTVTQLGAWGTPVEPAGPKASPYERSAPYNP
jgi:hypothetical protein